MSMLDNIRKNLKKRQGGGGPQDNSIFTFWNIGTGDSSTLRFLPFTDPYSGAFWTEKVTVPMNFSDNENPNGLIRFSAPCLEMYGSDDTCPVLNHVRALYKEAKSLRNSGQESEAKKMENIAGAHWKKLMYYFQGFVIKPGFTEESVPENPIRVFPLNKQLFQVIQSSILSEEDPFDILPSGEFTVEDVKEFVSGGNIDPEIFNGFNFMVKKNMKGGPKGDYPDWLTGSGWSRKETSLTEEQLSAIDKYGLHELSARLPDRPTQEQVDVLEEMVQVSIDRLITGENGVWRPEWEEVGFKPFRLNSNADSSNSQPENTRSSSRSTDSSSSDTDSSSTNTNEDSGSTTTSSSSLAEQIRNRVKNRQS